MYQTGLKQIKQAKGMRSQKKYLGIMHKIVLKKKGEFLYCIYKVGECLSKK